MEEHAGMDAPEVTQASSYGSLNRDPPAATLQDPYHKTEDDPSREGDPEVEEEEDDEAGSLIKMEESHSHDEPERSEHNEEDEQHHGVGIKQEDEDEGDEEDDLALPILGGNIDTKAYCLLDGIFEQKDGTRRRVTIPLTRLPAVLGRSHSTGDLNFFALGPAKALSRQHCLIDYRDDVGGKLVTPKSAMRDTEEESNLDYEKGKPFTAVNQLLADDKHNKENAFPPKGAFVLEALGKNLIMVGSNRLRQGEVAVLKSGTPIRMSTYSLYFFLPTDTTDPPKTMEIPLQTKNESQSSPSNKKNAPVAVGFKRKMPSSSSPSDIPKPKVKKPKAAPFAQLQAELDALPIETLLERMNEAVESERWERKHQLIGSTISLHAVKDATSAPEIREQAADGGVARTEIMRWIKESPKYEGWVEQMMSKMEAKSYQNTITKALLKAGNVRTGSGGRYIKWILPGVQLRPPGEGGDAAEKSPGGGPKDAAKENDNEEKPGNEEEEDEGGEDDDDEEGEGDDNDDAGEGNEEVEHENEKADGDDEEEERFEAGAPANFAEQRLQDEESEEENMRASFGVEGGMGEAESGNEEGAEHQEQESTGEGGEEIH